MNTDWTLTRHATTPAPSIASALEARALKNTLRRLLPGYAEPFKTPDGRNVLIKRTEHWHEYTFTVNRSRVVIDLEHAYRVVMGQAPCPVRKSKPLSDLPMFRGMEAA